MGAMTVTMKQLIRRHGAFVSSMTGIALVIVLMAQDMMQTLSISIGSGGQVPPEFHLFSFRYALVQSVPFGIGFFLSLWLVAPIAEELRVPHVITRAILATGIASTVTFVVMAVLAIIGSFNPAGSLFGNSFPFPGFDGSSAARDVLTALSGAITLFVMRLPLGVLAGILLWIWRKDHPPKRPLEGIIDL
jgi:hypothetical protein